MLRTVTTELKRAGDVTSSADAHSARVGAVVDPLLGLFLDEGQQAINGAGDLQAGIAGWIRHEAALAETSEHTHLGEVRTLSQLREQRDQEQEVLYRKALVLRVTIESSAGPGKSKQLVGLDPRLSEVDPVTLRRYLRSATATLEDPDFEAPEGTVVGAGGTPQATAADIKPALEAFEATLAKIEAQQRRVEETQRLKDEALARLRLVTVNGAKVLEGLYNLAGETFHAERLRRTRTRPSSSLPEEEPPPAEPAPAEPAVEPAADES